MEIQLKKYHNFRVLLDDISILGYFYTLYLKLISIRIIIFYSKICVEAQFLLSKTNLTYIL